MVKSTAVAEVYPAQCARTFEESFGLDYLGYLSLGLGLLQAARTQQQHPGVPGTIFFCDSEEIVPMVVGWGCKSVTPALYHPEIPST